MNVEIGTEALIFLSWEYLFQIFGILSLQCGVPSRESHSGLSYSKPTHYRLSYAAPYELRRTLYELRRTKDYLPPLSQCLCFIHVAITRF
jgi:hypothetical protein